MVVVDQAGAIAMEQIDVRLQVAADREGMLQAHRAMRMANPQRVAHRECPFVAAMAVDGHGLAPSVVIADVGVVVAVGILGNAPPGAQQQGPALALQPRLEDDAVPAARQRQRAAVGMVVERDRRQSAMPAAQPVVGAEHRHHLGLVVGLTERARQLLTVDLPHRALCIAHPQVAVVAEQVLGHLRLEAELERSLGAAPLVGQRGTASASRVERVGRTGRPVQAGRPVHERDVDRLVGAQQEASAVGIVIQFPAVGQVGAQRAPHILHGPRDVRTVQQQLAACTVVVLVGTGVIAGPQVGQGNDLHATVRSRHAHVLPARHRVLSRRPAGGCRGLILPLSRADRLHGPVRWQMAAVPSGSRHPQPPRLHMRKLPIRLRQPPGHHLVVAPQPLHVVLDTHAVRDLTRGALDVPCLAGRDQHHVRLGRSLGHGRRSISSRRKLGITGLCCGLPSGQPDGQRHDRGDFHDRGGLEKESRSRKNRTATDSP